MYIRYVAKTIDAEIEYYFDDVKVESFDAVSSMFEDYSIPSTLTGLSCNDADSELTLSYTVAKSVKNYAVQFAINGNDITTTDIASNKTYEISHIPNEADFDYGKIVFSVKLQKFDSSKVQIKYALESGYREDYDKYGDFKILIDGEEFEHSATTVADGNIIEIELYENNDLELDLSPLAKVMNIQEQ